jgi:hypothetical protein
MRFVLFISYQVNIGNKSCGNGWTTATVNMDFATSENFQLLLNKMMPEFLAKVKQELKGQEVLGEPQISLINVSVLYSESL